MFLDTYNAKNAYVTIPCLMYFHVNVNEPVNGYIKTREDINYALELEMEYLTNQIASHNWKQFQSMHNISKKDIGINSANICKCFSLDDCNLVTVCNTETIDCVHCKEKLCNKICFYTNGGKFYDPFGLNASTTFAEADWVVSEIMTGHNYLHKDFSDFAIIYRANFQSRLFEEALTKLGIPYVVFGSGSFYSRKEVKDLLAFCKCVINPFDVVSFRRALGTFKGVGSKTIDNIVDYALANKITYATALEYYFNNNARPTLREPLRQMLNVIHKSYTKCVDIVDNVFLETKYRASQAIINTEEAQDNVQIMDEFREMVKSLEDRKGEDTTLMEMLDEISLLTDAKGDEKANANAVKLMTAHASKGLEFNSVFIVGSEEGLFPHSNAIQTGNPDDIEEERRLYYVAMTRAQKKLYITYAENKKTGSEGYQPVTESRFIYEIPEALKEYTL